MAKLRDDCLKVMNYRLLFLGYAAVLSSVCLSGCSPQWIKEKVKERVVARRAARKKTHIPTRLEWRSRPVMPKAGLPAIWSLKILDLRTDPNNLKGIRTYDAPHGVAMHCFVVSRDGSEYAHLYPEPRDYGNFLTRPVMPRGGAYQVWVDFMPIDGYPTIHSQKFLVSGGESLQAQPWTPDKTTNGVLQVQVQAREEQSFAAKPEAPSYIVQMQDVDWQTNKPVDIKAWVLDENKKPVTDLQLHLGSAAYGIAISQDGERLVRLEARIREKGSNETQFGLSFPAPGLYKIWMEFRHADKIIAAPFVVRVGTTRTREMKGAAKP